MKKEYSDCVVLKQKSMKKTNSDKKLLRWAIVIIILLLAGLIYFAINSNKASGDLSVVTEEKDKISLLHEELENEYSLAVAELEELRGNNDELNNRIEAQILELSAQKQEINRLIKSGQDLNAARTQIKELRENLNKYVEEINILKAENDGLERTNTELRDSVMTATRERRELREKTTELSTENQRLAEEREKLSSKVSRASVLKTSNISVRGMTNTKKGKAVERSKAKQIDQLEICFSVMENAIVSPGIENYFIRITNPNGETISSASEGGGVTLLSDSNKEIRYTISTSATYNSQSTEDICVTYSTDNVFAKGDYTIEVYNKGYLSGKSTFKLK